MVTRRNFILGFGILATATLSHPHFASAAISPKKSLRFGWITDLHYGDLPARYGKSYRESADKLREFVQVMNVLKPDFVIETGDFKDLGKTVQDSISFLDKVESIFSKSISPRYHVLGNHDMDNLSKEQFLARVTNAGKPAKAHYTFVVNGVKFIVLDANYNEDGTDYCKGNWNWTKSLIPPAELKWLDQELRNTDLPVAIFCHQCLDEPGNPHGVINAEEVRAVIEASGKVCAVFQGHYHEGDYHVIKGIPYFTLNGAIEGFGPTSNAYAEVTMFPSGNIIVSGFRVAPSRSFQLK